MTSQSQLSNSISSLEQISTRYRRLNALGCRTFSEAKYEDNATMARVYICHRHSEQKFCLNAHSAATGCCVGSELCG
jgi:hypothetical protein